VVLFRYFETKDHPCSFQAMEDDTIPLAHPVCDASGRFVDSIFVAKGTSVRVPFVGVNRSEALWGADAGTFNPGRWLVSDDDDERKSGTDRKEEVQGYKHLLTFGHGPRMCMGKNFALLELKVRLSFLSCVVSMIGVRLPLTRTYRRLFQSLSGTIRSSFLMDQRQSWIAIEGLLCARRWRARRVLGCPWSLGGSTNDVYLGFTPT